MKRLIGLSYVLFSMCTAKVGFEIHGSIFWSIINFIFTVFSWLKWILFEEVNLTIIKNAFDFILD
jgi:hypothetical protein